jgi:lipoic acid synthetase
VLRIRTLGRVSYDEAWALQRALARHSDDDYLLVLEHPHTYTLGAHADESHVLSDPASVGAALVRCDRGGDVTYHGPGQLVVYPIVTVPDAPGAARAHVRRIEHVVIDTLRALGVGDDSDVGRVEGLPGVWVGVDGSRPRKIAAVGVRTARFGDGGARRTRTLHGVAINVDCDLAMFGHIVPCGLTDRPVTSMRAEGSTVTMGQLAEALAARAAIEWANGSATDHQEVVEGPAATADTAPAAPGARVQVRLRQAGVDSVGLPLGARKPEWLRAPARRGPEYRALRGMLRDLELVTVCEEAGCPNIYECWHDGTATFMVNGSRCTRACAFCQVDTARPLPLDPAEPDRVAEAVAHLDLAHAVVTCVARDDLADGGAGAIAETVRAIRRRSPGTAVEVLTSDCKGDEASLQQVFDARPDVFNHNIETVARLQRAVRPSAGYARSLAVLSRAREQGLVTKSGMMVGLGETESEVVSTLADLAAVGVSVATVGQYLRPSAAHAPVARWWTPDELDGLADAGRALGLAHVEASPLTRSSYHARGAAVAAGVG